MLLQQLLYCIRTTSNASYEHFVVTIRYIVFRTGVSDVGKDPLTLVDDNDMSPKDEAVGMAIPDGFRVQESRAAALDGSLVKRGVLVRLSMG